LLSSKSIWKLGYCFGIFEETNDIGRIHAFYGKIFYDNHLAFSSNKADRHANQSIGQSVIKILSSATGSYPGLTMFSMPVRTSRLKFFCSIKINNTNYYMGIPNLLHGRQRQNRQTNRDTQRNWYVTLIATKRAVLDETNTDFIYAWLVNQIAIQKRLARNLNTNYTTNIKRHQTYYFL
jgi:hypothetical protein